jgi:hypothetical protein
VHSLKNVYWSLEFTCIIQYSPHRQLKTSPIIRRAIASKATAGDVVCFRTLLAHKGNKQSLFKISWSACQDGQNSADMFAGGVAVGAMSYVSQ